MGNPVRSKRRGGLCIVCGEYVFITLAEHYKDKHMKAEVKP